MNLQGGNSGLIDDVYFLTATNSATFNSARVMTNLNQYYNLFVNEILDSQDDWDFQGQIATSSLSANIQNYAFPSDILKVKRLELSDSAGTWYPGTEIDINEFKDYAVANSASINGVFLDNRYSLFNNSIYLFPVPDEDVTDGLKLWYSKEVTELSADTMSPAFNESYHRGLSYGVSKDWFQKTGDVEMASYMDKEMEKIIARMKMFYASRVPEREYRLKPLIDNFE